MKSYDKAMINVESDHSDQGLQFRNDITPCVCPFCKSSELSISMGEWDARSIDPTDRNNTARLEEHQCNNCARSFWA